MIQSIRQVVLRIKRTISINQQTELNTNGFALESLAIYLAGLFCLRKALLKFNVVIIYNKLVQE